MNRREPVVTRQIYYVKILHMILMLVWPFIVPIIWMLFLFYYRSISGMLVLIFMIIWSYYSYFVLTVMRNYNLQSLAVEFCDFDAYLECMKFLEKFYLNNRAGIAQKINSTDAYIIQGNFDAAYQNLTKLHDSVQNVSAQTHMVYDYFWCRFYAEIEDAEQFHICINHFRNYWIQESSVSGMVKSKAALLQQELDFRDMLFEGKLWNAKKYLTHQYQSGNLGTRYEFMKYCYFMGRVEFAMSNFSIAKHWFAQTVSFGIKEHMSRKAQLFLNKLEEMQVEYASVLPENNTFYKDKRKISMVQGILSIVFGLIVMILLFVLK